MICRLTALWLHLFFFQISFWYSEFAMTPSLYIKYAVKSRRTQIFNINCVPGTQFYNFNEKLIFLHRNCVPPKISWCKVRIRFYFGWSRRPKYQIITYLDKIFLSAENTWFRLRLTIHNAPETLAHLLDSSYYFVSIHAGIQNQW